MMTNNNSYMLDRPMWEQLSFAPATGIAGTNIADDGKRYIYTYFQTSATAAQFWRYDTWSDSYQQLATPATQTGTVANMAYTEQIGGQFSGRVYGGIFLFVGNGTACYLYQYDIATNVWSANKGTTNVPATFATDVYLMIPSVERNAWDSSYHSGVTKTITLGSSPAVGATSLTVSALPEALASGTKLRFGTFDVTIGANAIKGATSLTVSTLPQGLSAGMGLVLPNGEEVFLSASATAGATSLSVFPIQRPILSGTIITVTMWAVLTASASLSATTLTVAPLLTSLTGGATAPYYGNMYLVGNNATVMYRYNIGANAWATTSANSRNPAIPAVTGTVGAGCALKWLPAFQKDKLFCLRGNNTNNVYMYDLVTNTWSNNIFNPRTEAFTTGTSVAARDIAGKQATLLILKDGTNRIYEGHPAKNTLEPKMTQWLYPASTAVVGDKSCVMRSPDGVDFYYLLLHSSTAFVRCALLDS
jgi:hypothetical protein